MSTYREFQAKSVDQAIEDACRYFGAPRSTLEIDIVRGGSAGIFGLGAKKAIVRACKRNAAVPTSPEPAPAECAPASPAPLPQAQPVQPSAPISSPPFVAPASTPPVDSTLEPELDLLDDFEEDEDTPRTAVVMSAEEQVRLEATVRDIMTNLLKPICPHSNFTVQVDTDPILVHIDDDENSGLVIGRDGHTITALQYVANRIIAKAWPHSARIQLDAGEYRHKQVQQLERIAQALSEKAKKSGRVQSTKPLSSFHRRVVHMTLQQDRGVQTRSKGEGPLKRVLIVPVKRHKPVPRTPRPHAATPAPLAHG